ncbi:MAG: protein tyrosine phosphatase family protein [Candidatus Igneacidithiobacillus chanchocoensis]
MDAENTCKVFDWLWTSGQLSERDIACLPTLGIEAIINLALPTSPNALPGEAEFITRQGIAYIHIPVVWERPELHQLVQFFGILKAFEGRKVWVHCAKNMRVSAFIYLYRRLCLAESEETSGYPMREVWVPNETWKIFIHSALDVLSNTAFERDAPKAARPSIMDAEPQ